VAFSDAKFEVSHCSTIELDVNASFDDFGAILLLCSAFHLVWTPLADGGRCMCTLGTVICW